MINIVIAAQQPIFRTGLAKLIATEDDLRIVAQPLSLPHLHNAIEKLSPHVVLLSSDFFFTIEDLAAVARLAMARGFAILMLAERVEQAYEFVTRGIRGVLPRKVHGDALIEGVRRVAAGEVCIQTEVDAGAPVGADPVGQRVASRLSGRELRIVAAMLRGHKNAEIAEQLGIALPLLKKYVGVIYDKAGVWGRLELALFVLHHQVLALAHPGKRPATFPVRLEAAGRESTAVDRMFRGSAKSGRRPATGSSSAGTSFGTTGAPPRCGK
jgi:DNA-binding NarL/FixJ family response regulator